MIQILRTLIGIKRKGNKTKSRVHSFLFLLSLAAVRLSTGFGFLATSRSEVPRPRCAVVVTMGAASPPAPSDAPGANELDEIAAFANELADIARMAILPYWRQKGGVLQMEDKIDASRSAAQVESPVTVADRLAERNMRSHIESRYPHHGIYGEEYGSVRTNADWLWVLDPIDGTKAFITGRPQFGTLIACLYRGVPVVGIIDQCVLKERWLGVSGKATTFNGQKATAQVDCTTLSSAMLMASTPDMFAPGYEKDSFNRMDRACKITNYGSDCYAYGLVASGFGAHVVCEADLGLYDYCAIVPVVIGAGGCMTDWQGQPLTLQNHNFDLGGQRVIACSNPSLHNQALKILNANDDDEDGDKSSSSSIGSLLLRPRVDTVAAVALGAMIGMLLSSTSRR